MATYHIGGISKKLGLSVDTLRYYEKIDLLPRIARNASGLRVYNDQDISRLQFIQRAQKMSFTLSEISQLMGMRETPQKVRPKVHDLTRRKLNEIEARLVDLKLLRDELRGLLTQCSNSREGCPIITKIDKGNSAYNRRHGGQL
jgi:MerR family transcriptional regulator, copper efflux regulator